MHNGDYTVLIQGPLNTVSLNNIKQYKLFCKEIVISYWDTCDESILESYDLKYCKLIKNPLPDKVYFIGKPNETFTYQAYSILHGVNAITTPYTIRTRSDEYYSNLVPLLDSFQAQFGNTIVCGNIFFKRWDDIPYHIGDHLFISNTQYLRDAYTELCFNFPMYNRAYCAEQAACWALLVSAGLEYSKENFEILFDVVDINKLVPFVASWIHGNTTFIDEFNDPCVIRSMEEL